MVESRVGFNRRGSFARSCHGGMAVRLVVGIKAPSTASARLTPESWHGPNIGMNPTLLIDRRNG